VERLSLTERVRSVATGDGRWKIPDAEPASTVVIARPATSGFEVLLMQRSSTMAFAPNMAVFPGGRVDPKDHAFPDPFVACAIREVHEEVGLELTSLIALDHWITPEVEPMRYDVRFYLSVVEAHVEGALVTTEAHNMLWLTPGQAHARSLEGSLPMLRPTQVALTELGLSKNIKQLTAFARKRDIVPRLPRPVLESSGEIRWDLVNGRTGELMQANVGKAKQETTGSHD
jgi:8-oxo-dGTP pyrophosphatase MutT (NUDIX family)